MKHIGLISDPSPSHAMNMNAIADELRALGHLVTSFEFPQGSKDERSLLLQRHTEMLVKTKGLAPNVFVRYSALRAQVLCEQAPVALGGAGLDCLMADILDPAAATVAERLGIPHVTICNAVPLHDEPGVPPDFLPWTYNPKIWARCRNMLAYRVRDFMIMPLHRVLNRYRRQWKLRPYYRPSDSFSPLAQITQLVREFDLPRKQAPACLHYVGPYRRGGSPEVPFPYERLNGRPLVYASLGTIHGGNMDVWRAIASGCAALPVQLVITLGKTLDSGGLSALPGDPIVIEYAPQRDLLARAAVTITHGGLNSAMEALAASVPMIVTPIIGDQFGVAARVLHSGTGEVIYSKRPSSITFRNAVAKVIADTGYCRRAGVIAGAIEKTQGAIQAARIIEEVARGAATSLRPGAATAT